MINWVSLAFNALWIIGLSIILAAFSYYYWLAGETARSVREVLSQPSWKLPFAAGMLLACIGFGYGLSERWWEKVIWTALALFYGSDLVRSVRQGRPKADS